MPSGSTKDHCVVEFPTMVVVCVAAGLLGSQACSSAEIQGDKYFQWNNHSAVITAQRVTVPAQEQDTEARGIYEGNVDFKYLGSKGVVSFRSDKLTVHGSSQTKMVRRVEMVGKVSMQMGDWSISSQEAFSENLNVYVDFVGDVTIRRSYAAVGSNLKSIRFDILSETILSREQ